MHWMEEAPAPITELGKSQPVGTKTYKCCFCGLGIAKGTKHNKYVFIDEDGKFQNSRFHIVCPWETGAP